MWIWPLYLHVNKKSDDDDRVGSPEHVPILPYDIKRFSCNYDPFLLQSLAGHFGGAWQTQRIDFAMFPGPVVITTNCVIEPLKSYKDRLYTLNETGIHGIKHLSLYDAEDVLQLMQVTLWLIEEGLWQAKCTIIR